MPNYSVIKAIAMNGDGLLLATRTYDTLAHAFALFMGYLAEKSVLVDTHMIQFIKEERD